MDRCLVMQMTQPSHLYSMDVALIRCRSRSTVDPISAQFPISLQPAEAQLTGAGYLPGSDAKHCSFLPRSRKKPL